MNSNCGIKIFNSMTQQLEDFVPLNPPYVKMYCCGPTVYGLLHVGNFRGVVFYNFLRNFLEHEGYQVNFIYNFTDVDDKIIHKAQEEGVDSKDISEKYIQEFWNDFNCLKLKAHNANPKVTETIKEIILFVEKLIQEGVAYSAKNGDVYYSIEKFPQYGKLSHRRIEDLEKNVRIEPNEQKKNPLDFALWKHSKSNEPWWMSPWGKGRPGWHIECSAMIKKHLGDQIDIHGGGIDLLFPHHENEIAQTEALTKVPFVKYWVHNNMIQVNGSKMSKSLGNIISGREFFNQYHPEIYKFMVLSVHYRSILDFSEESIGRSIYSLSKIYSAIVRAEKIIKSSTITYQTNKKIFTEEINLIWEKMLEAGRHDFNSALMISHIYDLLKWFNQKVKFPYKLSEEMIQAAQDFLQVIRRLGALMSLFEEKADDFLLFLDHHLLQKKGLKREYIQQQIDLRINLRKNKKFKEADLIRSELNSLGIQVQDLPDGSSYWEVDKSL